MSRSETGGILQILDERSPAGIITINPTLHAMALIEDFDLDIPSVTVSALRLKLLRTLAQLSE